MENNFSAKKLKETVTKRVNLNNIIVIKTKNKLEQFYTIMNLHNLIRNNSIVFIAINGITNYFRVNEGNGSVYSKLELELAYIKDISIKFHLPIIITNQVSRVIDDSVTKFKPVASSIINFFSDHTIIIDQFSQDIWKATDENNEVSFFTITNNMIRLIKK